MPMTRRAFASATALAAFAARAPAAHELSFDVAIIGGSTGGVAAALAACRAGAKKVVLTEETAWVGGQLTSQLVPPDENKWIESYGASQSFLDYRKAVRAHYRTRKDKPLLPAHAANAALNPGNGWVSRLCHEPIVGLNVLETMLLPFVASGQLTILRHHAPVSASTDGDRIAAVTVRDAKAGKDVVLQAKFFLDATDEGDLLPLAKVEHVTGTESKEETGEPHAADKPRPGNIQSFTWCCILEHCAGEEHVIAKPKDYAKWQPGFSWETPDYAFYPLGDKDPGKNKSNFWTYRRIVDRRLFEGCKGDVSVVNWHLNDYHDGSLHYGADAAKHRERSRQMTLSLVHWLQTESPRADGKAGWPGLRLCPEQTGSPDGLALAPYIRESRRIKAATTVREQDVSQAVIEEAVGLAKARAKVYPESVGIGHYLYIDIHRTTEGYSNGGGGKVFPFQIPLGSLIPQRTTNLLAACKNLGVTHLTNGCFRLHPIEWNVGESAGALAAYCATNDAMPHQVPGTAKFAAYRKVLAAQGVRTEWPAEAQKG